MAPAEVEGWDRDQGGGKREIRERGIKINNNNNGGWWFGRLGGVGI
jgi:hypothetical protein